MDEKMWLAILSSSLLSGVLGALIVGGFNLRAKRNEYVNSYYEMVLKRRLEAYEHVESLIAALKAAVIDADNRPYHFLFSQNDEYEGAYKIIFGLLSQALWLSNDLFEKTRDLNILIFRGGEGTSNTVEFGKKHYEEIANLRSEIEQINARDLLSLHNVKGFLKEKRNFKSSFSSI